MVLLIQGRETGRKVHDQHLNMVKMHRTTGRECWPAATAVAPMLMREHVGHPAGLPGLLVQNYRTCHVQKLPLQLAAKLTSCAAFKTVHVAGLLLRQQPAEPARNRAYPLGVCGGKG